MHTKIYYGEYRFMTTKEARLRHLGNPEVTKTMAELFGANRHAASILMDMEILIAAGKGTHYFVENGILEERILELAPKDDLCPLDIFTEKVTGAPFGIIHFPSGKCIGFVADFVDVAVVGSMDGKVFSNPKHRNPDCDDETETFGRDAFHRLMAVALYVTCFPHTMRDGFPDIGKHPAHYRGKACIRVSTTPEIMGTHDSPIPHQREGHPRYLQAPRFTNKRFQVIWVKGAYVIGRAKTIQEAA